MFLIMTKFVANLKKLNWILGVCEAGCCGENPRTGCFVSEHVSVMIWRKPC